MGRGGPAVVLRQSEGDLMEATRAAAVFGLAALLMALPAPAAAAGATVDDSGAAASPTAVVINEFAPMGSGGSTDEFVELRNTGDQVVALDGWELWACLSNSFPVLLAVFGSSDVIVPDGFLLLAHVNSNGGGPADHPYDGWDVPDDGGWLLSDQRSGRFDGVGLRLGVDCVEGDPAPQCDWAGGEAVTRDEDGTDTDDNAADFTCQPRTPGR